MKLSSENCNGVETNGSEKNHCVNIYSGKGRASDSFFFFSLISNKFRSDEQFYIIISKPVNGILKLTFYSYGLFIFLIGREGHGDAPKFFLSKRIKKKSLEMTSRSQGSLADDEGEDGNDVFG